MSDLQCPLTLDVLSCEWIETWKLETEGTSCSGRFWPLSETMTLMLSIQLPDHCCSDWPSVWLETQSSVVEVLQFKQINFWQILTSLTEIFKLVKLHQIIREITLSWFIMYFMNSLVAFPLFYKVNWLKEVWRHLKKFIGVRLVTDFKSTTTVSNIRWLVIL